MINEFWINNQEDINELRSYIKDEGFKVVFCGTDDEGNEILEFGDYRVYKPKQYQLEEPKQAVIKKEYTIVTSENDRKEMEKYINEYEEIAFDTETTGLNPRSCTMIGFSICGIAGKSYYYPTYEYIGDKLVPIMSNLQKCKYFLNLLKYKKLIMWNGSYDTRVINSNFDIDLKDALYIEGMLLKHTLQEEGPFALKSTGIELQEYIGLSVEEEANKEQLELKANIESKGGSTTKTNFEMYKADLDIIGKYGCSDADLTKRICSYYLIKLKEEGLEDFFFKDEVMPLYKEVTIPMEENGVEVDINLLIDTKNSIELDITALEEEVITELSNTEEFKIWIKDSSTKEFKPSRRGDFAQRLVKRYNLSLPKTASGSFSTAKKAVEKLPDSLIKSFFLNEDLDYSELPLEEISLELWKEKKGNIINISSKPQMGDLVFNYMKVKPLSKTPKGNPQFNVDLIDSLPEHKYKWASPLRSYNKLIKTKGSYIDRFLNNNETGKYYFSYKQHGTISGRYGSDAQQLPRPMEPGEDSDIVVKYNNTIRKLFIAGEDRVFIDCDYESLEPHVFAHVSGDPGLIDIFKRGHDFYSTVAISTEGLEEYSADKKSDKYLGKLNKQKRQKAKTYALGVPYGMGDYALGKDLDIPTEEASVLLENYLDSYPKLREWMDSSKEKVQKYGKIKSQAGRVRHLPEVVEIYKAHKNALMNFRYRNKLLRKHSREEVDTLYKAYKKGINNSRNFQIQSMASSIVNRAAIEINRALKKAGIDGYCCAQIHDQLISNVPKDKQEECKLIIQDKMENTTKLSLDLKAPPEVSENWFEGH